MLQLGAAQYENFSAGPKRNPGGVTISTQPTAQVKPSWWAPTPPKIKTGAPSVVTTVIPTNTLSEDPRPQPQSAGAQTYVADLRPIFLRTGFLVALTALGAVGGIAAWRRYRK